MIPKENRAGDRLLVPGLVRVGHVLADYSDFEKFESQGYKRAPLMAGPGTVFSENGNELRAAVIGYPKIKTIEKDGDPEIPIISITPLINISFDKLSATLVLYPPLPGHDGLTADNLEQYLKDGGLRYGIDEKILNEAKTFLRSGNIEIAEFQIARGSRPGTGCDASLAFALEIGPLAGTIDKEGRIDFRERRIMVKVERDQLIAVKIPAVPGEPGMNVLGETIEPKTGKDITVHSLGDAAYSADSHEIRATRDGTLSVTNKTTIKVSSRRQVGSDIDFKTGNVESNGCLIITGSVQPGFKVYAGGDLEIGGSVMSSTITGESNVVIKGGITGKNAAITVAGDVDIRFIEQGRLDAGGIVVIRTQAYFSPVTSGADIRCHPASSIMGGSLIAAGHLSVGMVGSDSGEPAILGAGIAPERLHQFNELQQQLKSQQSEIIEWLQMHGNPRSRKVRKMEAAIDETKLRLVQLNLIPGTELFSRKGAGTSRDDVEEINPLYHQGLDVDRIRIDIHGTAHEGTTVLLGNRSLTLTKPVSRRQFKLSADMKRIIALPLRL